MSGEIVKSLIVPAHPHPVLCPEKNEGWQKVRDAYDEARRQIEESDADLIIIYSTLWQHYWPPDSGRSKSRMGFGGCRFPRFR